MRTISINYRHTYSLGNFCSETIGLEATIDEREDEQQALLALKNMAQKFHEQNNPQLETFSPPIPTQSAAAVKQDDTPEPMDKIIAEMDTVTDIKVLETVYKFLAKQNPALQEAYQKKLNELSKK